MASEQRTLPIRITLVELRPCLKTIGGTINLTPLAMRYLDYLRAGTRLRRRSIILDAGLDYISFRTGRRIGNIWGGIGGVRVARHDLVDVLLETLVQEHSEVVEIHWNKRVAQIREKSEKVVLKFEDGSRHSADVLLGCDGLHSAARRLWVEPDRKKSYTGRAIAMGWGKAKDVSMRFSSGDPALRDTAIFSSPNGILLASYYEPTRTMVYFAHIMYMEEPKLDERDGWKAAGDDQLRLKADMSSCFKAGRVKGVLGAVEDCEKWDLYPVYVLPAEGRWYEGRVLLLGDAAHAMPPQGESTGLAIEDAILLAHILRKRGSQTVEQMFSQFQALRKPEIDKYYKDAMWAMQYGFQKRSWLSSIIMDWAIWVYLLLKRWRQQNHFDRDVRKLPLPG
ncbi:uncharacterized protein JN550_002562 [Neoarthrinium moseri]|uniref:uncharacterized protein n=1 Tax=Neoarthrinium moseri TaxID=1658444 RepID=UPI001FDE7AE2|nr:uncharacterized protein JN550_002562 [Neoarthrinium moseri]KAI1875133.1 hypothetical protein JN550_002562 [Neoarthrinium moseri]